MGVFPVGGYEDTSPWMVGGKWWWVRRIGFRLGGVGWRFAYPTYDAELVAFEHRATITTILTPAFEYFPRARPPSDPAFH